MSDEPVPLTPEGAGEFLKGPYVLLASGQVDCILMHPQLGDVPFTADADDVEEFGRMAHAFALTQL